MRGSVAFSRLAHCAKHLRKIGNAPLRSIHQRRLALQFRRRAFARAQLAQRFHAPASFLFFEAGEGGFHALMDSAA